MEQAIVFGKYENLLGITNIVNTSPKNTHKTAMIMITSGMLHNVGPFRLYVDIAKNLTKQGISSLRFDLSGIGDSLGVGTAGKSIDRAASEISEAIDYLENQHGYKNFILFGLCSGADDGMQTALKDKRVKGVINLDGLGYKTTQFKARHLLLILRKLLHLPKWINKLRTLTLNRSKLPPASLTAGEDIREYPETPEAAGKEIQQLIDRNVQLHFIYTGGTYYYNYSQQFYDMLPDVKWNGCESTIYFPHIDHVVTLGEDRKQVVDNITDKTWQMIQAF